MKLNLTFLILFIWTNCFAQNLVWDFSIDPFPNEPDSYRNIIQIEDSVFQLTGRVNNPGIINVTRINTEGDTIFFKNLNQLANSHFAWDQSIWKENGFVLAGQFQNRTWIGGFDSSGNLQWEHHLNQLAGSSQINKIKRLNDKGFLMIGFRFTDNSQYYSDIHACRLDSNGNLLWDKYYQEINFQYGHDFVEMKDGSFFISGFTEDANFNIKPYIFQIDINGDMIDSYLPQISGFGNMNTFYSQISLSQNGNAILSSHNSNSISTRDAFIAKIDHVANTIWDTIFTQCSNFQSHQLHNGNLLVYGFNLDSGTSVFYFDSSNHFLGIWSFPDNTNKFLEDVILTMNGNLFGAGTNGIPGQSVTNKLYYARYSGFSIPYFPNYCTWSPPNANFSYSFEDPILTVRDSSFSGLIYHDSIYEHEWYSSSGINGNADSLNILLDTSIQNSVDITHIITNWHGCKDTISKTIVIDPNTGGLLKDNNFELKVFPNPANDKLYIENSKPDTRFHFSVYNYQGLELINSFAKSKTPIDISKLKTGTYILKLTNNSNSRAFKFVKY